MNPLPIPSRRAACERPRRRSRNGCLTCKRRKVRCNEQRPRCFHCQRLGLDCMWKDAAPQRPSPPKDAAAPAAEGSTPGPSLAAAALDVEWPAPAADFFDFAQAAADSVEDLSMFQDVYMPPGFCDPAPQRQPLHEGALADPRAPDSPPATESPRALLLLPDTDAADSLLNHAPPILDPVENGPICASLRALLDGMAASSPMVRHAMAAFAAVQFFTTSGEKVDYRVYYDNAARDLAEKFSRGGGGGGGGVVARSELRYVLTTIFFLTYINVGLLRPAWNCFFADVFGVLDRPGGSGAREPCQGA